MNDDHFLSILKMSDSLDNSNNSEESDIESDDVDYDRDKVANGTTYTNSHAIPKRNEKSIRMDLEKLNLPSNIVNIADEIYQNMSIGTKRGKRRKMLLFFCAFHAYNRENLPVDPVWLITVCGLDRSSISKSLSMCSPVYTSSETPMVRYNPNQYIPVFFEKLSTWLTFPQGTLEDIYKMSDEIMEKDKTLQDEKPQTVAAAILVHYMKLHGYVIDKENYKTIFERSDMTINKIKKKVIAAYNE